jgi:hypothetical protein
MQSRDEENQEKRVRVIDTAFQRTQKHQQGVKEEKLQQQQKENQNSNTGTKKPSGS